MTSAVSRSRRHTVIIAGAANLFAATIKLAAGILAGSSAMLAERLPVQAHVFLDPTQLKRRSPERR